MTSNQNESLLLWDSGYTAERRRSFMFGSLDNVTALSDSDHWMLDGTFSSSPQLFSQLLTVLRVILAGKVGNLAIKFVSRNLILAKKCDLAKWFFSYMVRLPIRRAVRFLLGSNYKS